MIRVDANYIIQYFVNDNKKMAEIAEKGISYAKNTKKILCFNASL